MHKWAGLTGKKKEYALASTFLPTPAKGLVNITMMAMTMINSDKENAGKTINKTCAQRGYDENVSISPVALHTVIMLVVNICVTAGGFLWKKPEDKRLYNV